MDLKLKKLIDESIELEINAAKLYKLYSNLYPEDADFWIELSLEEERHADLLRTGMKLLLTCGEFPSDLLCDSLDALKRSNAEITKLLNDYVKNKPSKKEAFLTAIYLEETAGEAHYQNIMESQADERFVKIFQDLNSDDKDHSDRIKRYMKSIDL